MDFRAKVLDLLKPYGPGVSEEILQLHGRKYSLKPPDVQRVLIDLILSKDIERLGIYYWKIEKEIVCKYRILAGRKSSVRR